MLNLMELLTSKMKYELFIPRKIRINTPIPAKIILCHLHDIICKCNLIN